MQATLAIARLAIKSALRYRVFLVLALLVLAIVGGLPLVVKHDGTARGLAQITLTYTLGSVTVLLGFATLWISCGSIAGEVAESQLQMVDVKPVARWQVWIGKWFGIMTLNLMLLAMCSIGVYAMLMWRTSSLDESQRRAMQAEVLVARGSAREPMPELDTKVEQLLSTDAMKQKIAEGAQRDSVAATLRNDLISANQIVPPNSLRRWTIDLGNIAGQDSDVPMRIRFRFFSADGGGYGATYPMEWTIGALNRPRAQGPVQRFPAASFHELEIPPGLVNDRGELVIDCANRSQVNLMFMLEDGLEVVYREGGFAGNLIRANLILFCWLALLTTIGLAAGSGLSFPVAAFVALTTLVVGLSSGVLGEIVEQGVLVEAEHKHEGENPTESGPSLVDMIAIPIFKALLKIISVVKDFAPIDALSTGRTLPWQEVARALMVIGFVACGAITLLGIGIFHKRELAAAGGR